MNTKNEKEKKKNSINNNHLAGTFSICERNRIYSHGNRNDFKTIIYTHTHAQFIAVDNIQQTKWEKKTAHTHTSALIWRLRKYILHSNFHDTQMTNFHFRLFFCLVFFWSWNVAWKVNADTSYWNPQCDAHAHTDYQMCVGLLLYYSLYTYIALERGSFPFTKLHNGDFYVAEIERNKENEMFCMWLK